MSKPTVSVVMITYGHEKYIVDAISGVLMQNCNFQIELIISNDKSPDDTDLIVKSYLNEIDVPKNISLVYTKHAANMGMMPNFTWALHKATGKYIALCEGDDYWTDPFKLQKQVEFLEQDQQFSFCFHDVQVIKVNEKDLFRYPIPPKSDMNFFDIVKNHYIPTCSLLFRNYFLEKPLPEWFSEVGVGDIPLELLLASKGDAKYFNQKMAVYRRNEGGITQTKAQSDNTRSIYIKLYLLLAKELGGSFGIRLYAKVLRIYLGYFKSTVVRQLKSN